MRPLASVNTLAWDGSSAHCSSRSSTDTSPNSLTTMAKRCSRSAARRLASRVVLPDPRKPVKMVTGSLGTVSLLLVVHLYAGRSGRQGCRVHEQGGFTLLDPAPSRGKKSAVKKL